MSNWKKLTAYYGNPGTGDTANASFAKNLVTIDAPWVMNLAWAPSTQVRRMTVHKKAAPFFKLAFYFIEQSARRIAQQRLGPNTSESAIQMKIREIMINAGLDLFGGTYNHRRIRGSATAMSTHALGIAIDIDPANNSLGDNTPKIPLWVVEAFEEAGFVAGFRWTRRRDAMHFELSNLTRLAAVRIKHAKTLNLLT